jgi:2-polyprenyl-3-methyl-5-hydroxy-6-metoxy-1,4-benzoquinol methylase
MSGARVADIGCGHGSSTVVMARVSDIRPAGSGRMACPLTLAHDHIG